MEYERVKNVYILHKEMLKDSKENLRILHPLPRVNEIAYDVDSSLKHTIFNKLKMDSMHVKQSYATA